MVPLDVICSHHLTYSSAISLEVCAVLCTLLLEDPERFQNQIAFNLKEDTKPFLIA
jgi:hypothetical protein